MPEYLQPGVYIEEVDTGNKAIEGVSTTTAGFLGIAERGPIAPVLLTSFGDYQRIFGNYVQDPDGTDHYLAYAVEGFFQNGGLRCFVERVVHIDTQSQANSAQTATAKANGMTISAIGPGIWGDNIAYQIEDAGLLAGRVGGGGSTLFKLTLRYWAGTPPTDLTSSPTVTEVFDNLSAIPSASTFYSSAVNNISNLVSLTQTAPGRPSNAGPTRLQRGSDGSNPNVPNPNLMVSATAGLTPATALSDGGRLTISFAAAPATFTVNQAAGPIKTVADLMNAINNQAGLGAQATLDATGHLNVVDQQQRGSLSVAGTLAAGGAGNAGAFAPAANLNLMVSATAGLTPTTPLSDGSTLTISFGGAPTAFTVNQAAGPIKTVADLMNAINNQAGLGAQATLDAAGHLNIADQQQRNNLSVVGTLAAGGAGNVGAFAPAVNLNLMVGATAGLTPVTALNDGGRLAISFAAAPATFTVNQAAGPIKTVADLMNAINNQAGLGAQATLDAAGHLNIADQQQRGNVSLGGALAAGGAGNLGTFSAAASTRLTKADFQGDDLDPTNKTGLAVLGDVDEISLLCCPDEFYLGPTSTEIADLLKTQCEKLKDRFAILQAPLSAGTPDKNNPSVDSKYAAYYYPWLSITNPITGVELLVPPGGHITGIYARSDTNVGVQKDPANELINGIVKLQLNTNDQQQAILNPKGVNVLRYFKGMGNLVWGGRTASTDPDWKYINVRRIFIFVEKSILRGTQWVVFDINAEPTWARVRRSISDFLTGLWLDGVLQGDKKEQAFFVKCDRTTMTQADIDNGRLICVIGIAPVKPAEFVIFRIGQWYGGSDVSEQ